MNCESLYEQYKWKRQQQRQTQQDYSEQIKQMSSSKKINPHSHSILINRISEQLAPYPDQQVLNIETSIPLLHSTQILQAIQSIQSAKLKLQQGEHECPRLKEEARFVYCLWKMIDEEEIQTRELKEIVYMLNMKQPADLAKALLENYSDQQAVAQFVETWRSLLQENQYYKSMEKIGKKKNVLKQVQKLCENERRQGLRELLNRNESTQIRDYFLDSKNCNKSTKCLTMDTGQFSSKNKQNSYLDKSRQSELINRLYNIQKYKIREIQKKTEDERRQKQQIKNCTFKPVLSNDRLRSASNQKRGSSINGYSKAVHRMKVGIEKARMDKERRQYKPIGENYQKLREKKSNPPKFLQRKKAEEKIQFVIEFDLGRHKVKTKIHQNDNEQDVALNLCKIYCLKQDYFEQICMIIRKQRQIYESEQQAF